MDRKSTWTWGAAMMFAGLAWGTALALAWQQKRACDDITQTLTMPTIEVTPRCREADRWQLSGAQRDSVMVILICDGVQYQEER